MASPRSGTDTALDCIVAPIPPRSCADRCTHSAMARAPGPSSHSSYHSPQRVSEMNHERCRILIVDDQDSMHDDYRKCLEPQRSGACEIDSLATELFADVTARPVRAEQFLIDSVYQGAEAVDRVREALERGE